MKKTLFTLLLFLTVITVNAFYDHRYKVTMLENGKTAFLEGHIFTSDVYWGLYYVFVPKDRTIGENNPTMKNLEWDFYKNMDHNGWGSFCNHGYDYWQCRKQIYKKGDFYKNIEVEDLGIIR